MGRGERQQVALVRIISATNSFAVFNAINSTVPSTCFARRSALGARARGNSDERAQVNSGAKVQPRATESSFATCGGVTMINSSYIDEDDEAFSYENPMGDSSMAITQHLERRMDSSKSDVVI